MVKSDYLTFEYLAWNDHHNFFKEVRSLIGDDSTIPVFAKPWILVAWIEDTSIWDEFGVDAGQRALLSDIYARFYARMEQIESEQIPVRFL